MNTPLKKPRGPEPERVKIDTDNWAESVRLALQKPPPAKAKSKPKKRK